MRPVSKVCGIILAAGESKRMGRPKALLELSSGITLLEHQARVLGEAGCDSIACVLGSEADLIRGMNGRLEVWWLLNEDWPRGQFTSIQTGLAWMLDQEYSGAIVQPVDVVCESANTARSILQAAIMNPHLDALVPEYEQRGGHPVYVSGRAAKGLIQINSDRDDARLDAQIGMMENAIRLPVNDIGILKNANTPEEWEKTKSEILNPKS